MLTCNAIAELGEAYALGALDPEEAAEVERHVEACPPCRKRLDQGVELVSLLALTAPQHEPPPSLRRSLLAAAREELSGAVEREPWWRRLFLSPTRVAFGAAAFATLAFVVSTSWALSLESRLTSGTAMAQPVGAGFALERAKMHRLVGSDAAPEARGWIYVDPNDDNALLVAYKLPPLPADRAYQLWLIDVKQQRVSGGMFRVDDEGYGWLKVRSPQAFQSVERVGITIEPRAGSPGPTGARVLGGQL